MWAGVDRRGGRSKINVNVRTSFMDVPYSNKKTSVYPSKNNDEKEKEKKKGSCKAFFAYTKNNFGRKTQHV